MYQKLFNCVRQAASLTKQNNLKTIVFSPNVYSLKYLKLLLVTFACFG